MCAPGVAFAAVALALPSANISFCAGRSRSFGSSRSVPPRTTSPPTASTSSRCPKGEQSFFSRRPQHSCYRLANLFVKGPFIFIAAEIKKHIGSETHAWAACVRGPDGAHSFGGIAAGCLARLHPAASGQWHDQPGEAGSLQRFFDEFFRTFGTFFQKSKIVVLLAFLLLYRFGEAQLLPIAQLFLLRSPATPGAGWA